MLSRIHIILTLFLVLAFAGTQTCAAMDSAGSLVKKEKKKGKTTAGLTEEQERKYTYFFLEATRLRIQQDYAASLEMLEHCLEIKPDDAAAYYELAQYYLVLRNEQKGLEYLRRATEQDPDNYWFASGLVNMYLQRNRVAEAGGILEQMVTRFPEKVDPYFMLMQVYDNQQEFEKELGVLTKLEEMTEISETFTMQKVSVYHRMKDYPSAIQEVSKLIAKYPDEVDYQVLLGDEYLENDQLDEAFKTYESALGQQPDNASAMYSLARYYDRTGQKDKYDSILDQLLMNPKAPADTRLEVMNRYISEHNGQENGQERIIALFERLMNVETGDAEMQILYAQYLYSKNLRKEAAPVLEKVITIDPTNSSARMTLLSDAILANDYKEVIRLCYDGTQNNPDELDFYYYLALGYNQAGETGKVIETCNNALIQVSESTDRKQISDFYAILGDSYHTLDQRDEAYAAYDSCLVYNDSNIGALNNYAYYLCLEGRDLDRAEEMSYKTIKQEPDNAIYLDTYAWILYTKENYTQARIYIDQTLKNDEKPSADVLEHAGDIYFRCGEQDEAVSLWKRAKEAGSSSKTLDRKIQSRRIP